MARLIYPAPSWEDYLTLAVDETRQYGESSIQVVRRLRALLEDLRASLPSFRASAIDAELQMLDAAASRTFSDRGDLRTAAGRDRQGLGATDGMRSAHQRLV